MNEFIQGSKICYCCWLREKSNKFYVRRIKHQMDSQPNFWIITYCNRNNRIPPFTYQIIIETPANKRKMNG